MKRTLSSWVDFAWQNDLKWCTQHELYEETQTAFKKIIIIKSTLIEVSVYQTYNRISKFGMNNYNDQDITKIESAFLSSAEILKQSVLTTRPG